MSTEDAIVKTIMDMFDGYGMLSYYENLRGNNSQREMEERIERIRNSENSMCKYYCELDFINHSQIYNSMLSDYYRLFISRWRLSNHRLNIETGRYTKPITERKDRVCTECRVLEDEHHVVYVCPRYELVRDNYQHLTEDGNIKTFLNPAYGRMKDTASFIYDIEARRSELKL